jgi:CBS domain-containing protein
MKSIERCRRVRPWFEDDDEPTSELWTVTSLVAAPIVTLDETAPLDEARRLLCELRTPAIAIVDASREPAPLRGILTRTDVLRAAGGRVADAMSGFPFTVPADAPIERAAALMAVEHVGQVVVVGERGRLVGMVSALDIARYVAMRGGYRVA